MWRFNALVNKFSSGGNLPLKSMVLLSALLIVMMMNPLAVAAGQPGVFWRMLYLAVFCAGGYLLMEEKRWVVAYILIAIPALIFGVINESTRVGVSIAVISTSLTAILKTLLIFAVFRFSFYHPSANKLDRIIAGICGYIILGLLWSDMIGIVDLFCPEGFRTPEGLTSIGDNGAALYYSFVTLTTLGYGDISPANPWTRMLAIMEALSGTLYLAVFIASIVSQKHGTPTGKSN